MTQLQRQRRIDQRRARLENMLQLLTEDAIKFDAMGKPHVTEQRMIRAQEIRQQLRELPDDMRIEE